MITLAAALARLPGLDEVRLRHWIAQDWVRPAMQGGDAPVLIRIETKAGHGAGKPTAKVIEEQADIFGFLMKNLGM